MAETQLGRDSVEFIHRAAFWAYCQRTANAAKARSIAKSIPVEIDAYFIDRLLVDQGWRCAISGIPFRAPAAGTSKRREPFGPSLDRIVPSLGYIPGNVRVVCNMINLAMSEWGLPAFLELLRAMREAGHE